jgi:hypothetical protein
VSHSWSCLCSGEYPNCAFVSFRGQRQPVNTIEVAITHADAITTC